MNRPFWSFRTSASSDNCETIEPLLSLAADEMASPEETQRIDAHLPGCTDCRAALTWMQATHTTLASRPVALPPPDLHSRIALAIALSSRPAAALPPDLHSRIALAIAATAAAPVSLRPARVFTLRTAYAAAASLTALGIALSYPLWHTPGQVSGNHPAQSTTVAVVPAAKTPLAPKIAKRSLVASVPAKSVTSKHTIIARKTAPFTVTPLAHTASNDVPTILSVVPPVIKAPMHHAALSPHIASRDIPSTAKHNIEKHAPVPTLKTVAPKKIEGPQLAANPREPSRIPLNIQPTKLIPDAPVVQTASTREAPSSASSDPLGSFRAQTQTASATPIHYNVPQTYRVVTRMIQTVSSNDRVPIIGGVYSPR